VCGSWAMVSMEGKVGGKKKKRKHSEGSLKGDKKGTQAKICLSQEHEIGEGGRDVLNQQIFSLRTVIYERQGTAEGVEAERRSSGHQRTL